MDKIINFSGIGFEVGQSKAGLARSSEIARNYFSMLNSNGIKILDHGDIPEKNCFLQLKVLSENDLLKIKWDFYKEAYLKTLRLLEEDVPLLNWGGDHSIAISTVGAFCNRFPEGYVLWIDAHADINLPGKSLTGNFHGMPLSVLLNLEGIASDYFSWIGKSLNPKKLIYIGLREVDPFELKIIEKLKIKSFFYKDILNLKMANVANEILSITRDFPLHVSFDIDSVDPKFAPSTGVPVKSGLNPVDLSILNEQLLRKSTIRSLDIVEINPTIGSNYQIHQTYLTAFNFLRSIFDNNYQGDIYETMGARNEREYSS